MANASTDLGAKRQKVFVGNLAGTDVFDPLGERVGRIHDVVAIIRMKSPSNIIGFVVQVGPRRRVFLPLGRVTAIEPGAVITTGLLNMRRFSQRNTETLILSQLFDRLVSMKDGSGEVKILDVRMDRRRPRDWVISKVHVQRVSGGPLGIKRGGETFTADIDEISNLLSPGEIHSARTLIEFTEDMKAADVAELVHSLPLDRRVEYAYELNDERLADILEEMGQDDRVSLISSLPPARAADILEAMQPDDAADLISELPPPKGQSLLTLMEPKDAKDVRSLLTYEDFTSGALMTTEPVILGPDDTAAQMLASVRRNDLPAALASLVCVTRQPQEVPTGQFLGVVHLQRALREPPQTLLGTILDSDIEPVLPTTHVATVIRLMATYNLTAFPVVDEDDHLLGAVSVDDLLDELLPEDWRTYDDEVTDRIMARMLDG